MTVKVWIRPEPLAQLGDGLSGKLTVTLCLPSFSILNVVSYSAFADV